MTDNKGREQSPPIGGDSHGSLFDLQALKEKVVNCGEWRQVLARSETILDLFNYERLWAFGVPAGPGGSILALLHPQNLRSKDE